MGTSKSEKIVLGFVPQLSPFVTFGGKDRQLRVVKNVRFALVSGV